MIEIKNLEHIKHAYQTLDQFNLAKLLNEFRGYRDIKDVYDYLCNWTPLKYRLALDEFSTDDLMIYLELRYGITFIETISYKCKLTGKIIKLK